MKQVDLAYAAGFFDGEGSITISNKGGYVRIEVAVSQKLPAVLQWWETHFDGNTYHSVVSQWKIHGSKGVALLTLLLPYLIVKNVDAQEAIHIWSIRADRELTTQLINERKVRRGKVS